MSLAPQHPWHIVVPLHMCLLGGGEGGRPVICFVQCRFQGGWLWEGSGLKEIIDVFSAPQKGVHFDFQLFGVGKNCLCW